MAVEFIISSVNDENEIRRAVNANAARRLPAPDWSSRSGAISVCGNGPSLRDLYPAGGPIAALNGAWRVLVDRGIAPDYIVAHDPAPENVAWFVDAPKGPTYLLASRMNPTVFDMLRGHDVRIWHVYDDTERNYGFAPLIGGGFTIGCQAINLLNLMGFAHFDCYGYDSCFSITGEHHATYQPWGFEAPQPYQVGERMFLAAPWMAAQVQDFLRQIEANRWNYTVDVRGDGFLASALDHNTVRAVYDLDVAPGSFDFMCSMLNVENYRAMNGFSRVKVHFRPGSKDGFRPIDVIDVGHEQKNQMLNHVVRPLVRLFGMEETGEMPNPNVIIGAIEVPSDGVVAFAYSPRFSLEYFNETGNLPVYRESERARRWIRDTLPEGRPYVITLREAAYWPQRNSNMAEWVKFAKTLDGPVIFVRDTARADEPMDDFPICPKASLDLDKRLALYRYARMNFFVTNGPAGLAHYSRDIPYLCLFKDAPGYHCYDQGWLADYIGLPRGGQFPWAGPHQRLAYVDDTCENIAREWRLMQDAMVAKQEAAE